ncbi:MAG: glycosyltransferase family 39 protein [Planctomycetota bacterium]
MVAPATTLFGLDPCGHHATSVLWHAANVVLLFVLLRWATGAVWQSALASILFAVHPLRVESAAWVAERKDVLSAWFWLATMLAYVRYARAPSNARYVLVAILYALGLMAKPMLVSLPFALLLLDHWPPARAARPRSLVKEKLPLIVLAAASCVVTVIAQRAGGAVASTGAIPLSARIGNALTAYVIYLQQMLWAKARGRASIRILEQRLLGGALRGRSDPARRGSASPSRRRPRLAPCCSAGSGISARSCRSSASSRWAARRMPIATLTCHRSACASRWCGGRTTCWQRADP